MNVIVLWCHDTGLMFTMRFVSPMISFAMGGYLLSIYANLRGTTDYSNPIPIFCRFTPTSEVQLTTLTYPYLLSIYANLRGTTDYPNPIPIFCRFTPT